MSLAHVWQFEINSESSNVQSKKVLLLSQLFANQDGHWSYPNKRALLINLGYGKN